MFNYNLQASRDNYCPNLAVVALAEPAAHLYGVFKCSTHKFGDVIRAAGGVQILLPLFLQLDFVDTGTRRRWPVICLPRTPFSSFASLTANRTAPRAWTHRRRVFVAHRAAAASTPGHSRCKPAQSSRLSAPVRVAKRNGGVERKRWVKRKKEGSTKDGSEEGRVMGSNSTCPHPRPRSPALTPHPRPPPSPPPPCLRARP